MNMMYYECTIKYDKTLETGLLKKVSEKYLVFALNFSDAETRFAEYMARFVSGEFDVTAIRRLPVAEIFESDQASADRWFRAKLAYITLDERTGKEKRTMQEFMVHAVDFDDARDTIEKCMRGTLGDWVNVQLSETQIMDLIDRDATAAK